MDTVLNVGLKHKQTITITEDKTAQNVGSGSLSVFATPAMITLMENTCMHAVEPYLESGQTTVGVLVSVTHIAATAVGEDVTCVCELVERDRNRLAFHVRCEDRKGLIGEGQHERFIIQSDKFMQKIKEKFEH